MAGTTVGHASLQQAALNLGLRGHLHTPEAPFIAALHPALKSIAIARGACVSILPIQQQPAPAGLRGGVRRFTSDVTCLAWLAILANSSNSSAGRWQQQAQHQAQQAAASATAAPSSKAAAAASGCDASELLDHACLLSGTADGCLQLHVGATGRLLFRQRLHTGAVQSLHVRSCASGLKLDEAVEDLTACFADALVRITALELSTLLRLLRLAAQQPEGVAIPQRWELPTYIGPRRMGLCMGFVPQDLYSMLSHGGGSGRQLKLSLVTGGEKPFLAAFQVDEQPQRSTLQLLTGVASSLTSGVFGLAKSAAYAAGQQVTSYGSSMVRSYGQAAAGVVRQGLRDVLPFTPLGAFSGLYMREEDRGEDSDSEASAAACYDDPKQLPKPVPASSWRVMRDDARVITELVPAPVGALVAAADSLGRVCLFDASNMALLRMWKGYRDAQCGWLLLPSSHPLHNLGLLLVLYAPRRQALELWAARAGQRMAAVRLTQPCRLFCAQLPLHSWNNAAGERWQQLCPPTTYVLETESGRLWDVAGALEGVLAPPAVPVW